MNLNLEFAEPIQWNQENEYSINDVVFNDSESFTAIDYVPSGTELSNSAYWKRTGKFIHRNQLADDVLSEIDGSVKAFDTVADMQAATLEAGDVCHTNGFHTAGDGGAAFYKVTASGTANGMDVIACGDAFANLVNTESYVTPEMFGAWGDGVHDDSVSFNACCYLGTVVIANGNYYLASPITLTENCHIVGGTFTVPSTAIGTEIFSVYGDNVIVENCSISSVNDKTAIIAGTTAVSGSLSSNRYAFKMHSYNNFTVRNIRTNNIYSLVFFAFDDSATYAKNVVVENCYVENAIIPIFAIMCKGLSVSNSYLHTGTNAMSDLFHSYYISFGVDGAIFSNNVLVNEGKATGLHYAVGNDDWSQYGITCKNIVSQNEKVSSNTSAIELAYCENIIINGFCSDVVNTSDPYRCMTIKDALNVQFNSCIFNHSGRISCWFDYNTTISNVKFDGCTFNAVTRMVFDSPPDVKCCNCIFNVSAIDANYPTVISSRSDYAYEAAFEQCIVTSGDRYYFVYGDDNANSKLYLQGCSVLKTSANANPSTAVYSTNAYIEILLTNFIGYATITNASNNKILLSEKASY